MVRVNFNLNNDWQRRNLYRLKEAISAKVDEYDLGGIVPTEYNVADVPRSNLNVNIFEDPCNLIIDANANIDFGFYTHNSSVVHTIRKPFCTFPPKIVNRFDKREGLTPIIVPEADDNPAWINLLWNREYYYDGERDHTVASTGEGWKYDEINIELLEVKYPIEYERFFPGIEITLKVTYRSRKSDFWFNGSTVGSAPQFQELHSLNYEWVHTYKVWDKYYLNNSGYITRTSYGQYSLFAPHRADDPIALVYIQFPRFIIEDRWGENARSAFAVRTRSYFQSSLTDYEFNGSRDGRRIVKVTSPQRSYTITRDIDNPMYDFYGVNYRVSWSQYIFKTDSWEILVFNDDYIPPPSPPPPPPNKPPKKKMDCCAELRQLLLLVLRRIGPLPASVPNSLVKAGSGVKQIDSLAQYIAYSIIQANAQFGQFPQEIKIQDADLTQEGDQEKKITLPNVAESIAEIIGILLVLQSESNANLIATINGMIEAGSAKQAAILASDYASANAEFLGYKGKQIERQVAFTFKPGEAQLDKMLQPGEVKVKGWDNADTSDLNDLIMPILEMASMFRAQNFRNLGISDPLGKIRDILSGAADISTAIDNLVNNPPPPTDPNAPIPQPRKSDWDAFTEQAETGFITQPGITDNVHPYGRPLSQRPKIRDISTDTSETDNETT